MTQTNNFMKTKKEMWRIHKTYMNPNTISTNNGDLSNMVNRNVIMHPQAVMTNLILQVEALKKDLKDSKEFILNKLNPQTTDRQTQTIDKQSTDIQTQTDNQPTTKDIQELVDNETDYLTELNRKLEEIIALSSESSIPSGRESLSDLSSEDYTEFSDEIIIPKRKSKTSKREMDDNDNSSDSEDELIEQPLQTVNNFVYNMRTEVIDGCNYEIYRGFRDCWGYKNTKQLSKVNKHPIPIDWTDVEAQRILLLKGLRTKPMYRGCILYQCVRVFKIVRSSRDTYRTAYKDNIHRDGKKDDRYTIYIQVS